MERQRDAATDAVVSMEAKLFRARNEGREEVMKVLRTLTLGGSEYQTAEECADYVRRQRDDYMASIKRFKRMADEAREEGARAERSRLGRLVDARLLSFNISQDIRRCVGKASRARSEGEPR